MSRPSPDKEVSRRSTDVISSDLADMFDEISTVAKEKDRVKRKAYARINTNYGALNIELHCDKVSSTKHSSILRRSND